MRAAVLLAIIGAAVAAPPDRAQRIVGGSPTNIEHYPFMSNMMLSETGLAFEARCGGSLITTSTILSAAHCYHGRQPVQWRVRLGSSYRSSGGFVFNVADIIIHDQYVHLTYKHDVAIVKLTASATPSAYIAAARVAGSDYNLPDDTDVVVAGWGVTEQFGQQPKQLHHVMFKIINFETCVGRYVFLKTFPGFEHWPDVSDDMVCTGLLDIGGKDSCQGDSGGPIVHNGNVIYGVVSWGYGCARSYFPGVNARVSSHTDWIFENGSTGRARKSYIPK